MKIPDTIPWQSTGVTLGSGGQADVHVVTRRDDESGRKYALKALRNVESRQAKDRFRREIEVVKRLDHPSIVKVIDSSGPDDSFQFYVMEYHEGARTLAAIIFSSSNPYHGNALKCLDLFEKLVLAIEACQAHSPPVIHRDINPKNILVLPDASVLLIDFGICQVQDGQLLTLMDEDVGTRNYTSPECEAGNEGQIGSYSDLYSLGKVLWSTITSQRAFAREEAAFTNKSMPEMFPNQSDTWHLTRVFEKTVRAVPGHRCPNSKELLQHVRGLRLIVNRGFPPLEEVGTRCPSCGFADLTDFQQGHNVFGNPNPSGVVSIICGQCGFAFVRNVQFLRTNIQQLKSLK